MKRKLINGSMERGRCGAIQLQTYPQPYRSISVRRIPRINYVGIRGVGTLVGKATGLFLNAI
jgi:hypothetical protein